MMRYEQKFYKVEPYDWFWRFDARVTTPAYKKFLHLVVPLRQVHAQNRERFRIECEFCVVTVELRSARVFEKYFGFFSKQG